MTIIANLDTQVDAMTFTKTVNKYVYRDNAKQLINDTVITELPLQIRLVWQAHAQSQTKVFSITMRTPGNDRQLILGLLFCEGVIGSLNDVTEISAEQESENQWEVKLAEHCQPDLSTIERYQLSYSSCGLCGTTSLKSLELKNPPQLSADQAWLDVSSVYTMPQLMQNNQALFQQTGGVHAAALFDQHGQMLILFEDIGRHNAVDKLIGAVVEQHIIAPENSALVISSRISFEIIQKAVMAGIPVLIAVGAPTALAITAAKRFNLTLIGFASDKSFNLYHGQWRLNTLSEGSLCPKI